jgi:hypothetical protein
MKRSMWVLGMLLALQSQAADKYRLLCHGQEPGDAFGKKGYLVVLEYEPTFDADKWKVEVEVWGEVRVVVTRNGSLVRDAKGTLTGRMTPKSWFGGILSGTVQIPGEPDAVLSAMRSMGTLRTGLVPSDVRLMCFTEKMP